MRISRWRTYATKLFVPIAARGPHRRLALPGPADTSNSSLSEVDYIYILSYGFVVLTLAVIVRNSWLDATGDVARATRADRRRLAVLTGWYSSRGR